MGLIKRGTEDLTHDGKMEFLRLAVELLKNSDFGTRSGHAVKESIKSAVDQLAASYSEL